MTMTHCNCGITLLQLFWSCWAECLFFGITDQLRAESPKLRNQKCRSKEHFSHDNYMDPQRQYQAYLVYQGQINHILKHFEHTLAVLHEDTYCPHIPTAILFYQENKEKFCWEYLYEHKETLDSFIDLELKVHLEDFGTMREFVNCETFKNAESVHILLDNSIETMDLAPTTP